jgi:hypothetical protein
MKLILTTIFIALLSGSVSADSENKFQLKTTGTGVSAYLLNAKTGEVWFINPKPSSGVYPAYKPEYVFKYKVRPSLEEIFNNKGK